MQATFIPVTQDLYRLDVPFDSLYTSVFLLLGEPNVIVDAATTRADVQELILPALKERGIGSATLLLTHRHADHSGGAVHLAQSSSGITLASLGAGERLGRLTAIPMGGHTEDSTGYFDELTKTLLAGDGLQFYGVGKYGCSIVNASLYEQTLTRVANLGAQAILPSHGFIGGAEAAIGEAEVSHLLLSARSIWEEIKDFILSRPRDVDPFEIVREWRSLYPQLPPIPSVTVRSVRAIG